MSAPINNGGPAFPMPSGPEPRFESTTHYNEGMTLRDYFAAAALQGMLTDSCIQGSDSQFAESAYSYADAMLKARESK
jgi:hypothetical protein